MTVDQIALFGIRMAELYSCNHEDPVADRDEPWFHEMEHEGQEWTVGINTDEPYDLSELEDFEDWDIDLLPAEFFIFRNGWLVFKGGPVPGAVMVGGPDSEDLLIDALENEISELGGEMSDEGEPEDSDDEAVSIDVKGVREEDDA